MINITIQRPGMKELVLWTDKESSLVIHDFFSLFVTRHSRNSIRSETDWLSGLKALLPQTEKRWGILVESRYGLGRVPGNFGICIAK